MRNFSLKILYPVAKTWAVVRDISHKNPFVFSGFRAELNTIALFMNHSHASRKLVCLFIINPLALQSSMVTKLDIFCVHRSKNSVKCGHKLQIVAQ